MKTYYFSREFAEDECIDFQSKYPEVCEELAAEFADYFHWNHDGWECRWPITFHIREEEKGPILGTFEVERESVPHFSATRQHPVTGA